MAEDEGSLTEDDFEAWRDGDWVYVALHGEIVYRRLTRDLSFDKVEILCYRGRGYARRIYNLSGEWWREPTWLSSSSYILIVPIRGREKNE